MMMTVSPAAGFLLAHFAPEHEPQAARGADRLLHRGPRRDHAGAAGRDARSVGCGRAAGCGHAAHAADAVMMPVDKDLVLVAPIQLTQLCSFTTQVHCLSLISQILTTHRQLIVDHAGANHVAQKPCRGAASRAGPSRPPSPVSRLWNGITLIHQFIVLNQPR